MDSTSSGEPTFCGLSYARSLNFTDEQYEEAVKRIKSPDDVNQLMVALLQVSSEISQPEALEDMQCDVQQFENPASVVTCDQSSGTSSLASASTSSSSNQSLESLTYQQAAGATLQSGQLQSSVALTRHSEGLKRIYVDGSNVARTHGKNRFFSWMGIKICVDWFQRRGHTVKVMVPTDKCSLASDIQHDASILEHLKQVDALIETPKGCNDDMFLIQAARQRGGIIVSNDQYRDEKRWFEVSENLAFPIRLPYLFDDDLFILAIDPYGRSGPKLDELLNGNRMRRPQARRSLPEKISKRPLIVEEQSNQLPAERLIPIHSANQRQQTHPSQRDRQQPAPRLQLGRTKSHNY